MSTDQRRADKVVLYVEDEPVNVLLMRMLFERRPQLRLEVATSGQHALALAQQMPQPVLLLLDLRLPDCFGTDLLTLLRRQPGWPGIPAIAVTAEHGFEAHASGFAEVWRKPLDVRWVLTRLYAVLGLHEDEPPRPQAEPPRMRVAFAAPHSL